MLPRWGQVKGVHHHQALLYEMLKGLIQEKDQNLWTVKWQQTHNYEQLNQKAKINKWADIKLKSSIQQKKESQNEKAVYGMEENICKLFIW